MRFLLIILGAVLVAYCGADLVIQHKEDLQTEERFCRFRLCDDAMVQGAGFRALWEDKTPKPDQAIADFRLILQRDRISFQLGEPG